MSAVCCARQTPLFIFWPISREKTNCSFLSRALGRIFCRNKLSQLETCVLIAAALASAKPPVRNDRDPTVTKNSWFRAGRGKSVLEQNSDTLKPMCPATAVASAWLRVFLFQR